MLRQTYRTVARRTTKDSTTFRPCHQEHIGSWYRNLHSLLSSKRHVELHAQDEIKLNFSMEVGSVIESVTVAGAPLIQGSQLRNVLLGASQLYERGVTALSLRQESYVNHDRL